MHLRTTATAGVPQCDVAVHFFWLYCLSVSRVCNANFPGEPSTVNAFGIRCWEPIKNQLPGLSGLVGSPQLTGSGKIVRHSHKFGNDRVGTQPGSTEVTAFLALYRLRVSVMLEW